MTQLTDKQKYELTKLWEKKSSTIEYRILDLCVNILDGYQRRLEEYEKNLDCLNILVSLPDYQTDREGLHNSIITLQLLLGEKCLTRDCQYPRTLESALRSSGVDEQNTTAEVKRCEGYLERAEKLAQKSEVLAERAIRVTRDVLREKQMRGEALTTEERNALERVYDILSVDH